jgi:hypothetical protein
MATRRPSAFSVRPSGSGIGWKVSSSAPSLTGTMSGGKRGSSRAVAVLHLRRRVPGKSAMPGTTRTSQKHSLLARLHGRTERMENLPRTVFPNGRDPLRRCPRPCSARKAWTDRHSRHTSAAHPVPKPHAQVFSARRDGDRALSCYRSSSALDCADVSGFSKLAGPRPLRLRASNLGMPYWKRHKVLRLFAPKADTLIGLRTVDGSCAV